MCMNLSPVDLAFGGQPLRLDFRGSSVRVQRFHARLATSVGGLGGSRSAFQVTIQAERERSAGYTGSGSYLAATFTVTLNSAMNCVALRGIGSGPLG